MGRLWSDLGPIKNVSEKGSQRTDFIQMEKYHLQLVCVSGLPERLWLICGLDFQLFAVFRWLPISAIIDQAIAERVNLPPLLIFGNFLGTLQEVRALHHILANYGQLVAIMLTINLML